MSVIASKPCHEEENSRSTEEDDWNMQLAFCKPRHTTIIEGVNCITQTWRMKERVRFFPLLVLRLFRLKKITYFVPRNGFKNFYFLDENCERSSSFMFKCRC